MDHPPYSPNLVLSDFFLDLCLVLKEGLQGTKFNSDAEVVPALEEFFCDQVADFFLNCVNRWNNCLQVQSDYIEK